MKRLVVMSAAVALAVCVNANATMIEFSRITSNNSVDVASQLQADVSNPSPGTVEFTFRNVGPIRSSITGIYFDDANVPTRLATISDIADGPGVSFTQPATPADLPGGNDASPPFVTVLSLSGGATPPRFDNGINNTPSGEFVTVDLSLRSGVTFEDLIHSLVNGDVRVGLHVQGIGTENNSDSFVSRELPEPVTLLLLGLGALMMIPRKR